MDTPLSFYIAPRGQPALPVQPVAAKQLAAWSAETELQPGGGQLRRGGRWRVDVARVPTQSEALQLYDQLRAAGYPAQIVPLAADGGYAYSVRVRQLASEAEALALAARIKALAPALAPQPAHG
jgi:hypothetical protein